MRGSIGRGMALGVLLLAGACFALSPAERRAELQRASAKGEGAVGVLTAGLEDENGVVRRTAARLLARIGAPASEVLGEALDNDDVVVRIIALRTLVALPGEMPVSYLAKGVEDENSLVRQTAVERLVEIQPRTERVVALLELASKDGVDAVRRIAAKALWPFHREVISIREGTDRDIQVAQAIPLPKEGWRFRLDPGRDGHLQKWYEPGFDDSDWDLIEIEQVWQEAGYQHTGVTWYRRTISLPARPEHLAIELSFGGVDESAWVWVNGEYVGQHDIGPEGWNVPFVLDITREIRWGEENWFAVRAMNTAHAGGIWKPVQIEVLQ